MPASLWGACTVLGLFAQPWLWHGLIRVPLYWGVFVGALLLLAPIAPFSNWSLMLEVFREASGGGYERISDPKFAFALASLIGQVAVALAGAYLLAHVLPISLAA